MCMLTRIPPSWKMPDVLRAHDGLRLLPTPTADVVLLGGGLRVRGRHSSGAEIDERYDVRIEVPAHLPVRAPRAFETGGRISRAFHTMQDGSMCLGSPLAVRRALLADPSVLTFVDGLVIPYLFGHASRQRGLPLPFGELEHGRAGLEDELREDFHLQKEDDVLAFLRLAGNRRRVANQDRCYCGSRRLLRACHADVVNRLRAEFGRKWIRHYAMELEPPRHA